MDIRALIAEMTLQEKAGLCSGQGFWHTKEIKRLGIPAMMVSDGPHGLRKQEQKADHLGINKSVQAVCFPAGCAAASSFDRELLFTIGEALGNECQAEGVGVLLGPAVNIKRSPLCGRNFEYYSEDPYVAFELAASQIQGIQSKNVGACIKHFFANNQEHRRMTSSSQMDERTAREIYLSAFEGAVRKGKPWTVMCSYNKINGVYAAENHKYLTDVLRGEWGFDGFVISDWGAVNDRVPDLKAGMDLEMPDSFGENDEKIVEAVQKGELDEKVLDLAVERILNSVYRFEENRDKMVTLNLEADHELARRAASECMVLLKNEGILPLKKDDTAAFIGAFARTPRYQGGGSSHIHAFKVESALEMAEDYPVIFAEGYYTEEDIVDRALIEEAVEKAKKVKNVVIFAGLPDSFESEGYDRVHMRMPECQNRLIEAVSEANENVVVVLHNGSPVEMPWIDKVKAVLEVYLGGQAVGGATVDVLYGKVNPSGRLAETFPVKLQDNPSYLYYKGEGNTVEYREGVFVGYRYYDQKEMNVLFPFGHGLSYTTFAYTDLKIEKDVIKDTDVVKVSVDVTNTGNCFGKEVVQLYIMPQNSSAIRPLKELKGFEKIALEAGETKTVTFTLDKRSFAYYDCGLEDWNVETGSYKIALGQSSRKLLVEHSITVESTIIKKEKLTMDTAVGDILQIPGTRKVMEKYIYLSFLTEEDTCRNGMAKMLKAMLEEMPLRGLPALFGHSITLKRIEEMLMDLKKVL